MTLFLYFYFMGKRLVRPPWLRPGIILRYLRRRLNYKSKCQYAHSIPSNFQSLKFRGNSSCTGPSSGGINKPRVFEERQRGLSGQGGVNRGRREADGAEQGGKSPGQASWAQKGHADQLRVNGKPLEGFSRAMTQPEI